MSRVAGTALTFLVIVLAVGLGGWSSRVAAAPSNDNFANPVIVAPAALPFSQTVDTATATTEVGEPVDAPVHCAVVGKTVWYRFTPTASGVYQARTTGSSFDTVLAVFTGSSVGSLNLRECSDDTSSTKQSRLQFSATAGTAYHIQLGGFDSLSGSANLVVELFPAPPANNDLANAANAGALPYQDSRRTDAATRQPQEPSPTCTIGDFSDRSVWYSFTPPFTGPYRLTTAGSDFDTILAVYQGTTFGTMAQVACTDDVSFQDLTSALTFTATSGVAYRIQVSGFEDEAGPLSLSVSAPDTDGDGCADAEELSAPVVLGGDRNPADSWDFFDITADKSVDLADTLLILDHFGHGPNDDAVDDTLDRYAPDPAKPYRTAPAIAANEGIDLADALLNLQSFGHSCAGSP